MKRKCLLILFALMLVCAPALAQSKFPASEVGPQFGPDSARRSEEAWMEHLLEEAKRDRLEKMKGEAVEKEKDYDHNTVCSFGPQFREVSSRLTDQWYMFTPLDLSKEGTQTYELIAGNMYVIGELTVTVKGGKVTVDYAYSSRKIQGGREYFTFFPDFESVTEEDLENFHQKKHYTYGRAYDIEEKLGGDTDVLLFVCNTATFKKSTPGVTRYYETNEAREILRETMLDMIDK